jgi:hypothetical protein
MEEIIALSLARQIIAFLLLEVCAFFALRAYDRIGGIKWTGPDGIYSKLMSGNHIGLGIYFGCRVLAFHGSPALVFS